MSYIDVLRMPVQMLSDYVKWKIKYDEEIEKAKQKALESIRTTKKHR